MAFPTTPLSHKTEINLGGTWTDITGFVNQGSGGSIQVQRGHPDESTQTPASTSSLNVVNTDFRFSSLNPNGPYYPLLGRNIPLRYSLAAQSAALRMEDDTASFAATSASPTGMPTATADIRVDVTLSGYAPCQLLSWWGAGNRGWAVCLNGDGTVTVYWTTSGTLGTLTSASSTQPIPLGPVVLRVVLTAASSVTFYTAPTTTSVTGSAGFTQLGAAVVVSSSMFSASADVVVGANPTVLADLGYAGLTGKVADLAVLKTLNGAAACHPAFTAQTPGTTSWTDGQANTWTVSGSATIDQRSYRMHGEAAGWPQTWDPTSTDVKVGLSVAGLIRRLGARNKPAPSPMNRAVVSRNGTSFAAQAYWPFEDGANSTQMASGISSLPMHVAGLPTLGADSSFVCSAPLPQINNGILSGPVATYTDTGFSATRFLLNLPSSTSSNNWEILRVDTAGSGSYVTTTTVPWGGSLFVTYEPDIRSLSVAGNDTIMGSVSTLIASITVPMSTPMIISIELTQSGGSVILVLAAMEVNGTVISATGLTITGGTGIVRRLTFGNADGFSNPGQTVVGHPFVQTATEPLSNFLSPLQAWAGETAANRFTRLCTENGARSRIWGYPKVSSPMGAQDSATLMSLLQECVDGDQGMMYEPAECLGLGYRTLASLTNQAPGLTIAYNQLMHPMGVTEDDQITVNDVTVTNADGSSATQTLPTGPMGTEDPEDGGAGDVDQGYDVNLASDTQLNDWAGWKLNLGTVDQPRYPSIKVDLASTDAGIVSLVETVKALRIGDRVMVTTPAGMLPPGSIDQIIQGARETWYDKVLNFDFACVPALPYSTGLLDDLAYGRADTDGSQLHGAIGALDTIIFVDTVGPSGIIWSPLASDWPFSLVCGGEVIKVTAVSLPGNFLIGDDSGFDTSIGRWVNNTNAALAQSTAQAHLGAGSLQLTASGAGSMSAASVAAGSITTLGMPCSPGDTIPTSAWFRANSTTRTCLSGAQFYTSAGSFISTLTGGGVTDSAAQWTKATASLTAPATAAFARAYAQVSSAGSGEVHLADDVSISDTATISQVSQKLIVVRSVNGISKAHVGGKPLSLFPTPIFALL